MTASAPVTPVPALSWSFDSTVNGGHVPTQPVPHVLLPEPGVSFLKTYRVLPSSPVRNFPTEAVATLISYVSAVPPDALATGSLAAGALAAADGDAAADGGAAETAALGDGVAPLPLQAASTRASGKPAAMRSGVESCVLFSVTGAES